jgi:hypothetical protein
MPVMMNTTNMSAHLKQLQNDSVLSPTLPEHPSDESKHIDDYNRITLDSFQSKSTYPRDNLDLIQECSPVRERSQISTGSKQHFYETSNFNNKGGIAPFK